MVVTKDMHIDLTSLPISHPFAQLLFCFVFILRPIRCGGGHSAFSVMVGHLCLGADMILEDRGRWG